MYEDFYENNNTETQEEENYENSGLNDLAAPLEEIEEPEYFEEESKFPETYEDEEPNKEEIKAEKKRFTRLNKLGAKGIVKMLDIGNATLCHKISYSESALEYRADPEAIEDLSEVIEEIIPKKPGKGLKIPLWLQLIIFTLLAFLPSIFTAFGDRSQNRELKEEKEALKKLKKEKKVLKKKLEKMKLEKELAEAINGESSEKEKIEILTGEKEETDDNENN